MSESNNYSYKSVYTDMVTDFQNELQEWCKTGIEPKTADSDLRYYLDLQEKRLKKNNFSVELQMKTFGEVVQSTKVLRHWGLENLDFTKYLKSLHFQSVEKKVIYRRNGQNVYEKTDDYNIYITIIEPSSQRQAEIAEMDYVCPDCGAVSKVGVLEQSGCLYCGGHFIMGELFPKVTDYWFNGDVIIPEKVKSMLKKNILWAIPFTILFYCLNLLLAKDGDNVLFLAVISLIGGIFMGAVISYIFFAGKIFFKLLKGSVRGIKIYKGAKRGKTKISRFLTRFDENFTYEYFQGKVLSLLRTVILSENSTNLIQYAGERLDEEFEKYLNVNYAGGMGVEKAEVSGDYISITLMVYLLSTKDTYRGIEEKLEMLKVTIQHNASFKVDPAFSIQRVSCKGCGQSFNALKEKHCPYCGAEYHLAEDDWVITEISR
ncbi:MAG: hypothetical protein ACOX1F_05755 [Erysipelotrichaceae bacterium]|jgi:DNA-directed RNA polymerase subunit RPC12/RpoP/predicted Zn-ribbon and HTH transcriptional regulator